MSIEVVFVDDVSGSEFAQTVLESEQLPETFAINTRVRINEDDWDVIAADPVRRGAIERLGRLRLTVRRTVRRTGPVKMHNPHTVKFSMPTICDPLPAADPAVSLADIEVFVIDEDLWRDVEWVPRRHAREVRTAFDAIGAIRAEATGPFPRLHLRSEPVAPLAGSGLTVSDVAAALGAGAEPLDGVVIDTMGAGFIEGGFAFRLPDGAHVYGYCEDAGPAVLGLHREGPRGALPSALARLSDVMRAGAGADLIIWPYCERAASAESVDAWYRSGRACTKTPW